MGRTVRFTGHIVGVGTSSGTRLVLGAWMHTPHGAFADVMIAHPDGTRELLAPDEWVQDFVSATYVFDAVRRVPVTLGRTGIANGSRWFVNAGPLAWEFDVGRRLPLGQVLRGVPGPLARSRSFATVTDAVARLTMPGVRTLGSAGNDREEWYSPQDLHALTVSRARWNGRDLGEMTTVDPAPRFGFGSTPETPSVTALTSSIHIRKPPPVAGSPQRPGAEDW